MVNMKIHVWSLQNIVKYRPDVTNTNAMYHIFASYQLSFDELP